jgi:ribonuclease P protein subunit RPR2
VQDLAKERILTLLAMAEANSRDKPQRSRRYVELARRISSRYNVTIPQELKRRLCRECNAFLVPGRNLRVRAMPRLRCVVYECLECGTARKYGYARRKAKNA